MNLTLAQPWLSLRNARLRSASGWIGVDIGTHAIKFAQARRVGEGWRLGVYHVLRGAAPPADAAMEGVEGLPAEIEALLQSSPRVRRIFRGRRAACVLPGSLTRQQLLEIPPGAKSEIHEMLHEEILADSPWSEVEFAYWPTHGRRASGEGQTRVCLVSAARQLSIDAARCLAGQGFDCDVVDVMPTTLARVVELAEGSSQHEPAAVLDLGYSTPLLVVVDHGVPVFARQLLDCGLRQLLARLSAGLELSEAEASLLLTRHGWGADDVRPQADFGAAVRRLATPYLQHLAFELDRTLSYAHQHYAAVFPQRIWLCGGGGTIAGLDQQLAQHLNQPVQAWRLASAAGSGAADRMQPLLAAALALSLVHQAS